MFVTTAVRIRTHSVHYLKLDLISHSMCGSHNYAIHYAALVKIVT